MRARVNAGAAGWAVAAFGVLLAIALAVTAPSESTAVHDDAAMRAAIFREAAATELAARTDAARAFPGDPWSADDDFHNHEQRLARAIAARRGVPIETVLRALDEGLREHWQHPNPQPLIATVPPCHPRPEY